jgi:hypothetical protein
MDQYIQLTPIGLREILTYSTLYLTSFSYLEHQMELRTRFSSI